MFGLNKRASKKIGKAFHGFVTLLSSASIIVGSVTASYSQQIIVDPSAPGTSFLQTSNGTPQVNIATPQSGVSLNRFETFNVDQNGLVLNNSTSAGVSVIGQNVTANPNLMVSGPASTIVGEVTSAAPSTLTGTTEVFGQSAAVVIANPNGISCNGCAFLNSTSSTLTTGKPIINGPRVDLLVTQGTVTIGRDGFDAGQQAGVFGRHVIVDGPISTDGQELHNSLIVSGGAQRVRRLYFDRLDRSNIVTAPTTTARTSPFAVDISDSGTLTGGVVSVKGAETGQGVNIYGDVESRHFRGRSRGDLFYKNVDARFSVDLLGRDVRQYGDLTATRDVHISGDSFTLYDGRKILTGVSGDGSFIDGNGRLHGQVKITANDFVVIAGEVSGEEIHVTVSNGSLTNTGFLMADGELTILAGEDVSQQRGIAPEYDIYFDPALQQYLQAYYAQLITGGEEADIAAEMIARASQHEIIAEYIDRGATTTGTNVTMTATEGDITNTGGAIAATNDVRLTAGADIINTYLALRSRLDAEDGCSAENCGYRTDFHAGEILAGNDLDLVAGRDIRNEASDIAAANNVTLDAGRDVVNALRTSNFEANELVPVQLTGPGGYRWVSCGKDCSSRVSATTTYTANDLHFNEENVLAPARIASLYGDVAITADRNFVSVGSEITSGADLDITATGQAILSSYVDDEENFIQQTRRVRERVCTSGKDGSCSNQVVNRTTTLDGTVLVTATSEFVGRSISITSGENLTILGARILASEDLDLASTGGSVLIVSTDLPDTIALDRSNPVEFVELSNDLVAQIFGPASGDEADTVAENTANYIAFLQHSDLLTAVEALRRAESGADIKDAARDVGVQGYVSLIDSNVLQGLREDANDALSAIHNSIGAQIDAHNAALADYNADVRADLAELTELLEGTDAERNVAMQSELDQVTVIYDASIASAEQTYQTALATNEAQYGHLLTYQQRQSRTVTSGYGKDSYTYIEYYYVTVPNTYYVDLKNTADQNAASDWSATLAEAETQRQLSSAQVQASYSDAALAAQIADLNAEFQTTLTTRASEKATLYANLNTALTDATRKIELVIEQEALEESLRGQVIARGTVQEGEARLAQALTTQEFGELDRIGAILVDGAGVVQNTALDQSAPAVRYDFASSDLGYGILGRDNATGTGYILYLDGSATTRFNDVSFRNSDRFIAVTYDTTQDRWYYDNNGALVAFTPRSGDRLVARVNYTSDTVEQLDGINTYIGGVAAGYSNSDLSITANQWNGSDNAGEFGVSLTYLEFAASDPQQTTRLDFASSDLGYGILGRDNATGTGYILYLDGSATTRFNDISFRNSDRFIAVTYDTTQDRWYYDNNGALVAFTPRSGDRLVARVNYTSDTVEQLDGINTYIGGVAAGYSNSDLSITANQWNGSDNAGEFGVSLTYLESGESSALLSEDQAEQDAFLAATAWRFATHEGLNQLSATPRTVMLAEDDLSLAASEDIYVTGETALAAVNDLTVDAGRRIGLLGAINTNFRLNMGNGTRETGYFEERLTISRRPVYSNCGKGCSNVTYVDVPVTENVWVSTGFEAYDDLAYDSFAEIGETLQLGTLMRDPSNPVLNTTDGAETHLAYARQTGLYDLTSTSLTAGGDLSLTSGGDILNFGGSLVSGENLFLTAETDIRNEALRHNFTLTPDHGCVAYGCGREGHEYKAAEILAGSGMVLTAGGDIVNNGAVITAAGSILAQAEGDIVNSALTSQYLYHYISSSGFFGLKRKKEQLHRAVISEGVISTEYGDVILNAGRDVLSEGAMISAGADVQITAVRDLHLTARSEELHNYYKKRGFSGLSYGENRIRWNEFSTAFSQIEGNNIALSAGRDVTGMGALLFAARDIDLTAGEDITFDAHQNLRYVSRSGWSVGISGIIEALLSDGDILEAYVNTNPTLAAVHRLATGDFSAGSLINLAYHLPSLGSTINQGSVGNVASITDSLVDQLNPFSWMEDNAGFNPDAFNGNATARDFLNGITFRLGAYKSRQEWTESHVSQLIAGQDLWIDAGKDIALVGGTVASGNRDVSLYAGENVLVAALADTSRSSSSGWGLSLGFGASGVTFGADFNRSRANARMYTNAALTAGGTLDIVSGQDTVLMGANLAATDIYLDVGNDLIVQSRQNTSNSNSFGFNFSTSGSFGLNYADANRNYTDTPTTIVAQERLSIYTGETTYLLGAGIWSEAGNLEIDTGTLVFDNYHDTDQSTSVGINGSLSIVDGAFDPSNSDLAGTFAYRNVNALTFATIGEGTIRVRDLDGYDFSDLNRDPDNMQRVISETDFSIEIPGINLARWTQQVENTVNLIEAIRTRVPDHVRAEGRQAVDLYRDAILGGYSRQELAEFVASGDFEKYLRRRKSYEAAIASDEKSPAELARIAYLIGQDERLYFDENDGQLKIEAPCATSSAICGVPVSELENLTEQQVSDFIEASLNALNGKQQGDPEFVSSASLALQCAMYWHISNNGQGGNSGRYLRRIATQIPDTPEMARSLGLQPHALTLFKIASGQSDEFTKQQWLDAWTPWLDNPGNARDATGIYDWAKTVRSVLEGSGDGEAISDYELGLILYSGSHIDRRILNTVNNAIMVVELVGGFAALARNGVGIRAAPKPNSSRANEKVTWVDENAGMSTRAQTYDDGAYGARSNVATQNRQAPALSRTTSDGQTRTVKFDGLEGDVLIDRKLSVVTTAKAKNQAVRQSEALQQNGLTARWEVPTQTQANRAEKMFRDLGIDNITVRVVPE